MNKNKEKLYLGSTAILASLVVALGFLWWAARSQALLGQLKLKVGDSSLEMQFKNRELRLQEMLSMIFANPEGQTQAKALLAKEHGLFALDDPALADALERLSPRTRLGEQMRDLVVKQRGPFKRELTKVLVSFPSNANFPSGSCVVCSGSDLFSQTLVLYNQQETYQVQVDARNSRACRPEESDPSQGPENIQVTVETGHKLFGQRPLRKFEEGWVGPAS
ncbi:MAG: hypothetical protein HYX75_14060 [Acidobacteria bacterium]|nr:hypothetical protein [Acidobacteriota bacterium]